MIGERNGALLFFLDIVACVKIIKCSQAYFRLTSSTLQFAFYLHQLTI